MGAHADKGNKNSFYLKQQLNNRGKHHSKDRATLHKNTPMVVQEDGAVQHRKNHSVVINRERIIDSSPDRIGNSNKALKLPGMQYSEAGNQLSMYQNDNNYTAPPSDYIKSINQNQSATNAGTRAMKKKGSTSSIGQNKAGTMTPSIERGSMHKKQGSHSIN